MNQPHTPPTSPTPPKQENGFVNIIVNIIIPVMILNKLTTHLGALFALLLALAFPISFGLFDLFVRKRKNFFSLLGLINISITGSLAILHLDGVWFWVKEALFPFLIGLFVIFSAFSKKPFIETIFLNPQLLHIDLIQEKLKEHHRLSEFHKHIRTSTIFLSFSFFFSAISNFILATRIFSPIDSSLSDQARAEILNGQIAQMTSWAAGLLIIPSMLIMGGILWYLVVGIKKQTGLTTEQIFKT